MTKYENLISKSNKCLEVAKKSTGNMQFIWLSHSEKLKKIALSLTLEEAKKKI